MKPRFLYNNSIGKIFLSRELIDLTLYLDDDEDGIVDRKIQPNEIICWLSPYPPNKPSGPILCYNNTSYTYFTNATDPENDPIYYMFDWGDGNFSDWLGPYESSEIVSANHTWVRQDICGITVKAKDIYEIGDGDGDVDTDDLLILLAAWGQNGEPGWIQEDINVDGVVDVMDLLVLLANWS